METDLCYRNLGKQKTNKELDMCPRKTNRGVFGLMRILAVIAIALTAGVYRASAQVGCDHGAALRKSVRGCANNNKAHIGDTVTVRIVLTMNDDCPGDTSTITNVYDVVNHFTGPVTTGNLLPGGTNVTLQNFQDTLVIDPAHTYLVTAQDGSLAGDSLTDQAFSLGFDNSVSNPNGPLGANGSAALLILKPRIGVTKTITNSICGFAPQCAPLIPDNLTLYYVGTVTNSGNTELFSVMVVDDQGTPGDTSDDVTNIMAFGNPLVPGSGLLPGAKTNFSGSYPPHGEFNTNIVTASGHDVLFSCDTVKSAVSATATAGCNVVCCPAIKVSKFCFNAPAGSSINFTGTVCNTGNTTLHDVTVYDNDADPINKNGTNGRIVFGGLGTDLASGVCQPYSSSYVPPASAGCPATNTVFATGHTDNAVCGNREVHDSDSAQCGLPGTPSIKVVKTCQFLGDCSSPMDHIVVKVTNTGDLILTNVVVIDSKLGLIIGPETLQANGNAGDSDTYTTDIMLATDHYTNVVVATGTSKASPACGLANVSNSSTCTVFVAGTPRISITKTCYLDSANSVVVFGGQVCNTSSGGITLEDITVTDAPTSSDIVLDDSILAQGDCTFYRGSYPVTLPTGCNFDINFDDTVTATGHDRTVCALAGGGTERTVMNTATCRVNTNCQSTAGCRTTGGGKQLTSEGQVCPTSDGTRYVTHGGQVGASFGVAGAPDCATDTGFNSVCIRGEFQHVRHMKGGLRGNFHAAGNGNEHNFDSLMCACLPCNHTDFASPFGGCHPADRTYVANATSPGRKNDLCNPGDRVCGPEPRKAPANKICFSGVADYTMSNGKKTPQSVAFRVDLEDRGEPGGAHPKGGTPPPDRYRMRMWFIGSGATDNRFSGAADSANNKALRATVACKDATDERIPLTLDCVGGSTPAPNIDDGGDLDRGNRQIHPNTSASCH